MNYAYDGPGKPPRAIAPTMQDSLALYNNTVQLKNFLKKSGYKKAEEEENLSVYPSSYIFGALDEQNKKFNKLKAKPGGFLGMNNAKITTNKGDIDAKDIQYRKNLDENKFLQREAAYPIMNLNAPMQLFDRRIKPNLHQSYDFIQNGSDIAGENIDLYTYDPIAVKPVSLLTPQERAERERKYGSISKNNPKQQQVLQIAKKIVPKPIPVQRTVHAPIDFLEPKQAQLLARLNNLEQPMQLRTIPMPNTQDFSTAQSLRYPAQGSFVEKLQRKFQGKPNIPYWVDKYGNERYPKYGENTEQQVREMRMLTNNLDPQNMEDAIELARIQKLRMMSPEDRSAVLAQERLSVK